MKNISQSQSPFQGLTESKLLLRVGKMDFDTRFKSGREFENQVCRYFDDSYGLTLHPYGLELHKPEVRVEIANRSDSTSEFIRFGPDFVCSIPDANFSFLIECKSSITSTPYYAIDRDAYNLNIRLRELGVWILYVFPADSDHLPDEYKAQWAEYLQLKTVRDDPDYLKTVNGSGKPFVLIPKIDIPPLYEVLTDLFRKCGYEILRHREKDTVNRQQVSV